MSLVTVLTALIILAMSNLAFALSLKDISAGSDIPNQNININVGLDGTFKNLTYIISSTGATSGIRYRTSAITITLGGQTATIDISALVGHAPAREQIYSQIAVTKQDILSALPNPNSPDVLAALDDPTSIQIGANIQIYNAATGQVLATITNKDDVAPIASKIGFGSQDISDMESRWQEDNSGYTVVTGPDPDHHDHDDDSDEGRGPDGKPLKPGDRGYRLRPSILVK